ncbi:MAG: hypothetical protein FWG68_05545 [Defluviitaleaceae bacterium]|nr:hypothetical protein [Defluviitaleaceae bacterium]
MSQQVTINVQAKTPEFEDYTKDDPYFTPEVLAGLAESEEQARRGEIIWFSMEELMDMGTGGSGKIPQRGIDFSEKYKRRKMCGLKTQNRRK